MGSPYIVPILKPDNSIRICGDYKTTVNQVPRVDNYPIPKVEDLLATLGGAEKFTKLDMSQAYQQLQKPSSNSTPPLTHTKSSFNIIGFRMESRLLLVSSNAT